MKAKKVLALLLAVLMIFPIALMSGCSGSNSEENSANTTSTRKIVTLNMYVITDKSTNQDMARQVQMKINQILLPQYKTMVKINYVPEEEYWDTFDKVSDDVAYYRANGKVKGADDAENANVAKSDTVADGTDANSDATDDASGADAADKASPDETEKPAEGDAVPAENADASEQTGTDNAQAEGTDTAKTDGSADNTGAASAEGTVAVDENGNPIESEVPLESDGTVKGTKDMNFNELIDFIFDSTDITLTHPQLDVFVCNDYDRFSNMVRNEEVVPMDSYLDYASKVLKKYIYPTFLSAAKVGKSTYGIPTNYGLDGEMTYFVYNKNLLDKYGYKVSDLTDFSKLGDYLALIKRNESGVWPISEPVGVAGAETYEDAFLTISKQFNMIGNSTLPTFMEPNYTANLKAVKQYKDAGYYPSQPSDSDKYAIRVVKSSDMLEHEWRENGTDYVSYLYDVARITNKDAFKSAMCISSLSNNKDRAMELITLFNTNSELANLLQYGIEGTNYIYDDETGTVSMLDDSYMMNTYYTGNTYIKYPLKGGENLLEKSKAANLSTAPSAFLGFNPSFDEMSDKSVFECTKTICNAAKTAIDNGADFDTVVTRAKRELVALGCVYVDTTNLGGIFGTIQKTQAAQSGIIAQNFGISNDVLHYNDVYGIVLEETVKVPETTEQTPDDGEATEGEASDGNETEMTATDGAQEADSNADPELKPDQE